MSKLGLSSSVYHLKFGLVPSLSVLSCISKFSRIVKNWVEETNTLSVKKGAFLKIWKICSVQNYRLEIRYEMHRANFWFSFKKLTPILCSIFGCFLSKEDVWIHTLRNVYPKVQIVVICESCRPIPVIWNQIWLYLDKVWSPLYIGKRVNFGTGSKLKSVFGNKGLYLDLSFINLIWQFSVARKFLFPIYSTTISFNSVV